MGKPHERGHGHYPLGVFYRRYKRPARVTALVYALPDHARFSKPTLESHLPEDITGEGFTAKVFLGELLGQKSPVHTYLPLTGAEFRIKPNTTAELTVPAEHEHGLVQVTGAVFIDGVEVPNNSIGFVPTGRTSLRISAGDEPVIAVLIGGEPLGEQIVMWWNMIGRTHEEIALWRDRYMQEMGYETPDAHSPAAGNELDTIPDELLGTTYDDGGVFPQFGEFPPNQPAPMRAPQLPNTRLRPRG